MSSQIHDHYGIPGGELVLALTVAVLSRDVEGDSLSHGLLILVILFELDSCCSKTKSSDLL